MESNITAILTQKRSYNTCCMLLGSRNVAIHYWQELSSAESQQFNAILICVK